ncbi:sensor histidine kinase [Lapidilactobacillus mulanensis]|uniref:histidine kinase n=1 Tax=Lapidilactobacillus mulanensis TaxID=2485999 RepID=A0ABW4DL53_9LACO|nr:sensor histidine kinase [Lapidilactobacillus mulanensis]
MQKVMSKGSKHTNKILSMGMQSIIMLVFSTLSIIVTMITGVLLYERFSSLSKEKEIDTTQEMAQQTRESLEDYLIQMRQISDAVYYDVVKENDLSLQTERIHSGMNLLYQSNKNNLSNIAIYNHSGSLMAAEPVALQKEDPDVTSQDWYQEALAQVENIHFSTPHIQNLFDNGTMRYDEVISLSRAVELSTGGESQLGVLLVDMDYYQISHIMDQLNTQNNEKYFYLCDSQGKIIYHPKQTQIARGITAENNQAVADYQEGSYDESFRGEKRKVIANDISYTGWKLVGVIPATTFKQDRLQAGLFMSLYLVMMAMVLVVVNRLISLRISRPLKKLNDSVTEYESGKTPNIYSGGSSEIRHLGESIQQSYEQNEQLMQEVIVEHNERRKSELDVLQSQINPHFLYNTLDSITWMIEGERNEKAVFMITQLAKLFRVSLSKGRTIISIADELQHAKSYMNIQKERYQESISVEFEIDPQIEKYATVKLILQPILENSLNYAVRDVDDEEYIRVVGKFSDGDIVLSVTDNGIGMSAEQVSSLLSDSTKVAKKGSGVGLVNVNKRIQLHFGTEYGLTIKSKPDEGTTVVMRFPAIPYSEETRKRLEQGLHSQGIAGQDSGGTDEK